MGLEEGDTIAYLNYNAADYLPTNQGFASAGVTPALINTSMRGSALKHCIDIAQAKYVIIGGAPEHEEAVSDLNLKIPVISVEKDFGLGRLNDLRSEMKNERFEDFRPGPLDISCLI